MKVLRDIGILCRNSTFQAYNISVVYNYLYRGNDRESGLPVQSSSAFKYYKAKRGESS